MAEYTEYIVRYYASHEDIPKGHYDGEILTELTRCKDCRFWPGNHIMAIVPRKNGKTDFNAMIEIENRCLHMGPEDYCSKAERRE